MDDPTVIKTGTGQIRELIELLPDFGLPDTFKFGQIVGPNGQSCLLFDDQYQAWLAPRLPKPPRIQFYLQQATELRKHLEDTPDLTQTALARELNISRSELIHTLNLLKLTPEIHAFLMALPPNTREHPITKKKLRRLSSINDYKQQKREFNRILASVYNPTQASLSDRIAYSIETPHINGHI